MTLAAGSRLGPYEILAAVGAGGMGEVYKARDTRLEAPDKSRPVVVLTRQEVIGLFHTVMVAPITSTRRGAPSEVPVGPREASSTSPP